MRKKSKKKQIVAMTLALSVLSSSVGMCGASAAEALSDTDDSGLQVTIVPLADNTETPAPTAESKTPAQEEETPAENEQPVASTGDNTNQPTDGEGDGDNTSSDDKPTIERPEQSETVETLPGTAEDNKDHIKGEDKDDSKDDTSEPETLPKVRKRARPLLKVRKRAKPLLRAMAPAPRKSPRKSPRRPPKRMTPTTAVSMTRTPVISRSPSTSRLTLRATRPLS